MKRFLTLFIFIFYLGAGQAFAALADMVVVHKAQRRLELFHAGQVTAVYHVALGWQPLGAKIHQGDGKTPEGLYTIAWHNSNSHYHRALAISYPRTQDIGQSILRGVNPGNAIMIHGQPNEAGTPRTGDWTDGCIAVSDREIEEIYEAVPDGTPIMILP